MNQTDIAVVGAGLSGMACALACARTHDVTLIDARPLGEREDARASFLATPSVRMLERLGVEVAGEPVLGMETGEGHPGEPLRGDTLDFGGAGPLGRLVENAELRRALIKALRRSPVDIREGVAVHDTEIGPELVVLHTDADEIAARLLVAADGPRSALRTRAGIGVETHDYRHEALTFTVAHTRPHHGKAYQIFHPSGPLALLPLTGQRSSVVWTDRPGAVRAARALTEDALATELARRIGEDLGELTIMGPVESYPLHQVLPETLIADRLALVGDAAHVIHPLAGQGLNLGLRDAAALAEVVADAAGLGRDIGGPTLGEYDRWRRGDVRAMALATDALGHAYSWRGPLGALRRAGTAVVAQTGLSKLIAREAAGERGNLPALMA